MASLSRMHSDAKNAASVNMKKPGSPELTNRRLSDRMTKCERTPYNETPSQLDNDPSLSSNGKYSSNQDLVAPG